MSLALVYYQVCLALVYYQVYALRLTDSFWTKGHIDAGMLCEEFCCIMTGNS